MSLLSDTMQTLAMNIRFQLLQHSTNVDLQEVDRQMPFLFAALKRFEATTTKKEQREKQREEEEEEEEEPIWSGTSTLHRRKRRAFLFSDEDEQQEGKPETIQHSLVSMQQTKQHSCQSRILTRNQSRHIAVNHIRLPSNWKDDEYDDNGDDDKSDNKDDDIIDSDVEVVDDIDEDTEEHENNNSDDCNEEEDNEDDDDDDDDDDYDDYDYDNDDDDDDDKDDDDYDYDEEEEKEEEEEEDAYNNLAFTVSKHDHKRVRRVRDDMIYCNACNEFHEKHEFSSKEKQLMRKRGSNGCRRCLRRFCYVDPHVGEYTTHFENTPGHPYRYNAVPFGTAKPDK